MLATLLHCVAICCYLVWGAKFYYKDGHLVCLDLHTGWVKHDTNLASNGLWRQVSAESATNDTIGSVRSAYFSPIDAELVAVFVCSGSLGDEGHLLSIIEFCSCLVIHALDLNQRHSILLVAETSLVTKDGTIDVKAGASLCCCRL